MPDIKIFVSHRIDINSELIDNPVYVPVRCGAVFDNENPMGIAGDDTGDNISKRRMSFCELTVQYWAWKNAQADYYGLCHYRRYLSFADRRYKTDEYNMVFSPVLTPRGKRKYGLLDSKAMETLIGSYDVVTSEYAPVKKIPLRNGPARNVEALWEAKVGEYFMRSPFPLLLELIDTMAPEYSASAREYLAGDKHRGYNCYVMRRELFDRLCRFQFPILFEAEQRLDTTGYTQTMRRTVGFMGEILYGIFLYHLETQEYWRIKKVQLVYFQNAERIQGHLDLASRYAWLWTDRALRAAIDPIFPKGSERRERLKSVVFKYTPIKRRGVAEIKQ